MHEICFFFIDEGMKFFLIEFENACLNT